MDARLLHDFRKNLRRGLVDAGFYPYEAMDIVEKAQRLADSTIKSFPPHFFDVNQTLMTIAQDRNITRDDAWYMLQKSPDILFEAAGVRTWSQLREERQKKLYAENDTPVVETNDNKPWKNGDVKLIPVEGFVPSPPSFHNTGKSILIIPTPVKARTGRTRLSRTMPSDETLARIALEIKTETKHWPLPQDGAIGLPPSSPPWYLVFAGLRKRKTTLANIVHATFPEIEITPTGRFKTATEQQKQTDAPRKRGKTAKPLPSPELMIPVLEKFQKEEGRLPGMSDARKHLPEDFPAWSTFYMRIRKDLGMNMRQYYRAHKSMPFKFNRASKDSVRKKLFREQLQNGMGNMDLPKGLSGEFIQAATVLYDDRLPVPARTFFDMERNIRVIARQNAYTVETAKMELLKDPRMLFELHEMKPLYKQATQDQSLNDIITATLQTTLRAQAHRLPPDLLERLTHSYHAFNEMSQYGAVVKTTPSTDSAEQSLLRFVFEDNTKVRSKRRAGVAVKRKKSGLSIPDDTMLWNAMETCKQEKGRLPRLNDGNKYLPQGSPSWSSVYNALKERGMTFSLFYATPPVQDDKPDTSRTPVPVALQPVASYK